jgi:hypothetical protein
MTELMRTDLPTSRKVQLAASALGQQGQHGAMTALARDFGVARGTVYSAKQTASEVLAAHFVPASAAPVVSDAAQGLMVRVDEAQIRRAIASLRVVVPGTLRPIEDLLPILYPGLRLSYGTIQGLAVDAEVKAAVFNALVELSGLTAGALDELFSQGRPVLGGIGLDTGYAFCLQLRESRSAEDWAEVLRAAKAQGLDLDLVVKDAAQGIAAGLSAVYPECQQRDDCFHVKYELGKVQRILEQRAFGAIARLEETRQDLLAAQTQKAATHKWHSRLWWAEKRCATAIELHDTFERAAKLVDEALEFVDLRTCCIRSADEVEQMLRQAAQQVMNLTEDRARKVGRYLLNRTPGLVLASRELEQDLRGLATTFGEEPVALASYVVRLLDSLDLPRNHWQRPNNERLLLAAFGLLRQQRPDSADALVNAVRHFVQQRHRASSAIEGLNSSLRPHLYVHRGVTQGFLELFRAYFNLRNRRSGPYQGLSAYERLTGKPVQDWLTLIGLPPTASSSPLN